jgi:hypothetical protein
LVVGGGESFCPALVEVEPADAHAEPAKARARRITTVLMD